MDHSRLPPSPASEVSSQPWLPGVRLGRPWRAAGLAVGCLAGTLLGGLVAEGRWQWELSRSGPRSHGVPASRGVEFYLLATAWVLGGATLGLLPAGWRDLAPRGPKPKPPQEVEDYRDEPAGQAPTAAGPDVIPTHGAGSV